MKKRIAALAACAVLSLTAATAEPALVTDRHLAWIGEMNYLYIEDATGAIKRLPASIADLLAIRDNSIYCLASDGSLYDIHLDGTPGSILSSAPSAAQLDEARAHDRWSLENGVLTIHDASAAAGSRDRELTRTCVIAGEGADVLFYVERTYTGKYLLQTEALPVTLSPLELGPVAVLHDIEVSLPISMTVANAAVSLVGADRSVELVSLVDHSVTRLPAISTKTAAAAYCNAQVIRYVLAEDGSYQVEEITDHLLNANGGFTAATATPVPTVAPTTVPTAAPTATAKTVTYYDPYKNSGKSSSSSGSSSGSSSSSTYTDNGVYKGMRGTAVRRMQQRLQQLGYPVGSVDGAFGEQTLLAVHLFQNALHVKERDGLTEKQLSKLYAATAPIYDVFLPLRKGDSGTSVLLMQRALAQLGFNPGKLDGIYGKNTVTAVAAFQQAIGLPLQYGEVLGEQASHQLLELLYAQVPGTFYPTVPAVTAAPVNPYLPVTPGRNVYPIATATDLATATNLTPVVPAVPVAPVVPSVPSVPSVPVAVPDLPDTIGSAVESAAAQVTVPPVSVTMTPPPAEDASVEAPALPELPASGDDDASSVESMLNDLSVTVPPLSSLPTLPPRGTN